jgi:hypothetical protein
MRASALTVHYCGHRRGVEGEKRKWRGEYQETVHFEEWGNRKFSCFPMQCPLILLVKVRQRGEKRWKVKR